MKKLMIAITMMGSLSGAFAQDEIEQTIDYNHDPAQYLDRPSDDISYWCNDRLGELTHAFNFAQQEYRLGNAERSLELLEEGLVRATQRINRYRNSLTARAILRGVSLARSLKATTQGQAQQIRTLNHFLFNYYDFIEEVAKNIDIPYYSAVNTCRYCSDERNDVDDEIENAFMQYSQRQVEVALNTMASTDDNGVTFPVGSPRALLKALELTTQFYANDLRESLGATRYACTIVDLEYISRRLADFNSSGNGFHDMYYAIQESVSFIRSILGQDSRCYQRGHRDVEVNRSISLLTSSYTMAQGSSPVFKLGRKTYVENIIIDTEGMRTDARYQVVVNGKVKGTIHVPNRDPSYWVTVRETTSEIKLVSETGSAVIHQISVYTR